jgi:hypothetical protein
MMKQDIKLKKARSVLYIDFVFAGLASALVAACCYFTLKQTGLDKISMVDVDVGIVAFCVTFIAAMLVQDSSSLP